MKLYKVKWYLNDVMFSESEEAFWCDSDLEERYDKQILGIKDIIRYEYEFIKVIKLPENLFDFSNYKC